MKDFVINLDMDADWLAFVQEQFVRLVLESAVMLGLAFRDALARATARCLS